MMADNDGLRARLEAAERVCALYGWTGAHHDSDRGKALHELWRQWCDLPGSTPHLVDHPELTEGYIAALARKRDAIRERTLERIRTEGR
jgi:hypothetical protein